VARPSEQTVICPLTVEGIIRHPGEETAWEYSVVVEVHDQRGQMIARRVVGVGAMQPGEARGITLRVELHTPGKSASATPSLRQPEET
jgi:hypothetical protein